MENNFLENKRFDGDVYNKETDQKRLTGQIKRVFNLMKDGKYRTLGNIAYTTGDPESSVSAQLRNLRKQRFGGFTVEKRSAGNREKGLFEYKLLID